MSNSSEVALDPVAVAGERADHHHRALRERHVAVLHVLDHDARGERRDRLVAEHLVHRLRRQLGPLGEQAPLVRAAPRTPAARARAATAWCPRRPRARSARGACTRPRRAGRPPARRRAGWRRGRRAGRRGGAEQRPRTTRRTRSRPARSASRSFIRLGASNWRWIQFDQSCSRGASSSGAPITVAIVSDGYGLAKSRHELAAAGVGHVVPELLEEARASPGASDRRRAA